MQPAEAIDVINARFGRHPRRRALHSAGIWCRGTFTATPHAAARCRAVHLRGEPVPVLARLSNGAGHPRFPDNAPGIHGLAVKFEPPGGEPTDLVCQTVPRFPFRTAEEFVGLVRAGGGGPLAPAKLAAFAATHPRVLRDLPVNAPALRPLAAYATTRFYAVHAFRWVAADGAGAWVRCDWRPQEGERRLDPLAARRRPRFHLQEGVADRLQAGRPVRWTLEVQVAGPGDDPHDPSSHWPSDRERFDAGTLELTDVVADPEAGGAVVVFDPMRLANGIEPSDDPVLRFRPHAYAVSVQRRAS